MKGVPRDVRGDREGHRIARRREGILEEAAGQSVLIEMDRAKIARGDGLKTLSGGAERGVIERGEILLSDAEVIQREGFGLPL